MWLDTEDVYQHCVWNDLVVHQQHVISARSLSPRGYSCYIHQNGECAYDEKKRKKTNLVTKSIICF